jgi:hypothetical protein
MMKLNLNYLFILLFAILTVTSCQDEVVDITSPEDQEVLQSNSPLVDLMSQTSSNSGSYDDFLDNSSCFSIELPVTIIAGDITITIDDEDALEDLEDFLEEFDDDDLDFIFPITIIFNDYTEIVINNAEELEELIDDCSNDIDDDIIDCIDFVYPISFSVFNTDFDVIDTIVIDNDEALYNFLDDLDDDALIVSLDYPVTLVYGNGETIEVNSNQELADAIDLVSDDCGDYDDDDDEDCDEASIATQLTECVWEIDDLFNDFDDLYVNFNEDGTLNITGENLLNIEGNWEIITTEEGIFLELSDLTEFEDALEGSWLIIDCDDDEIELLKGDVIFELEQECDDDDDDELFDCFFNFDPDIEICDDGTDGPYTVNLTEVFANCEADGIWYFESYEDAENFVNPIANPEEYSVVDNETTLYVRIDIEDEFVIVEIEIYIESCDDDNPFDCYDDEVDDLDECDDDGDGFTVFNLYEALPSCDSSVPTVISFHSTAAGAETNTDFIEDATAFTNTSSPQTVYIRVTLFNNQEIFEIYPVELYINDCDDDDDCSEAAISDFLQTCTWIPVSYNGDDHLTGYTLAFGPQEVTIEGNGMAATTTYSVQGDDPTFIFFDGISLPEIQALSGDWTVISCEPDQLELQRNDDILILEQNCN